MHSSRSGPAGRWAWMLVALLAAGAQAQAPAGAEPEERGPLAVGTKEAPPFAFRDADGLWQGMSIDLWRAVAADLGLEYEMRELPTEDLLASVEDGSLDAAVAAFTITAERETRLDFTHPFYISGLGIAVATGDGEGTFAVLRSFFSLRFLRALGALLLVLLAAGVLLWAFERRRNADQFGGGPMKGLGSAFWWSAVTMTTVGYGDKAPVTAGGRLVALVWMFVSIVIISGFTAAIASALTVRSLESRIRGPEDLPRVSVGTLRGTTSAGYLAGEGLPFQPYATADEGLAALAAGKIDALVYDAPILRYKARRDFPGKVLVLESTFQRQDYGIALPTGSGLREELNSALLTRLRDPWWPQVVERYLGE